MFNIIVSIIAVFAMDFFLFYSCDEAELWTTSDQTIDEFRLRQPAISDLADPTPEIIDRYVRMAICPAYEYFLLRDELAALNKKLGDCTWLQSLFFQAFFVLLFGTCLNPMCEGNIVRWLAAIGMCILLNTLSHMLYRRTAKLQGFGRSKKDMVECFAEHPICVEFSISNEDALNLYMIEAHSMYLQSIKKSVRTRATARNILDGFCAILYAAYVFVV